MTIGYNVPGMQRYSAELLRRKQQQPVPGAAPMTTMPGATPARTTTPRPNPMATPTPQPNQTQMGGYVERQAARIPTAGTTEPVQYSSPEPKTQVPGQGAVTTQRQGPDLQDPGQVTGAGKSAAAHVTDNATRLGQDPGQISEAGKLYAQRVTQGLQGDDPLVKNAQQTEDTAAARRAYLSRQQTEESLGQSQFAAGSAQYQRAQDQAAAQVHQANQAGQAGVNQFTRERTADNMAAARDLENQQYNRNQTNLAQAQGLEDNQYGKAVGERTNRQQETQRLSSSIQDPKAKYAFDRAVAAGADPQKAYQDIVGQSGTINEQYRGQSPVQQVQQDATDWVKATQPNLQPGSPEFQQAVTARMQATDKAQNAPVTAANKESAKEDLREIMRSGGDLTPEQTKEAIKTGVIPTVSMATIPAGTKHVNTFLKDNPGGKIAVGGEVYTIVKGSQPRTSKTALGNPRHTDVTEMKDGKGNTVYYYKGEFHDKPPAGNEAPAPDPKRLVRNFRR